MTDLPGLGGRYHYRPSGDGYDCRNGTRLIQVAERQLAVVDLVLDELGEIDTQYWFEAWQPTGPLTVRDDTLPLLFGLGESLERLNLANNVLDVEARLALGLGPGHSRTKPARRQDSSAAPF